MSEYILQTEGLCKMDKSNYRVKDLCLKVPAKCVYGFLGPNGAGKTTTLKLVLGLIHSDGGSIEIMGQKVTKGNLRTILKKTGSLIESPAFYGHLTGWENMEVFAKYKKVSAAEAEEALREVRLWEQRDKKVDHYSLGMKQRLGIAIAMLGNPELLILDEPTNGLDPAGIHEIRQMIKDLPERKGISIIVSSHLLGEIEQMADYVGIINHGQMLYQGPLADLKQEGNNLEDVFLKMTEDENGSL